MDLEVISTNLCLQERIQVPFAMVQKLIYPGLTGLARGLFNVACNFAEVPGLVCVASFNCSTYQSLATLGEG